MANIWSEYGDPYLDFAAQTMGATSEGAWQYGAQKEANKSNERIARETNEANALENEKAREFEREMWEKQAEYESYANKRKMAEEAGYNPYAVYGQQIGTPSSGTPPVQAMQGYEFKPEDGLSNIFSKAVENIGVLADAREKNANAEAREIRNIFEEHAARNQARSAGYDADVREVDAISAQRKKQLELEGMEYANENMRENAELTRIEQQLQRFNLFFKSPQEYNMMLQQTKLFVEKQITEQEYREYLRKSGNAAQANAVTNYFNAQTERMFLPYRQEQARSQAEFNTAAAGVESQRYVGLDIENAIKKVWAEPTAAAELRAIIKKGNLSQAESEKAYNESKRLKQQIDWNTYNEILQGVNAVTSGAGNAVLFKFLLGM